MDVVKVQYTVKAEFVETNKQNIARVMEALGAINSPDIKYSAFLLEDGKTFVHLAIRANEEAAAIVPNLPAFQDFQKALRASGPEVPPLAENMNLVGTNWDFF